MKRIFISLCVVLLATTSFSQARLPISYTDFEKWAKQIKIAGYPFMESELEEARYSAMLASGPTKVLQISASDIKRFYDFKSAAPTRDAVVYTWNGHKAVYYFFADVTMLTIELAEAQVAISFGISGKATKAAMEDIALKSNLQNLKIPGAERASSLPSGVKWPAAIPAGLQISNVESIKALGPDGTYKEVIEVKATMGPQLVASLQAIMKKYNGELSNITVGKVTFLCGGAESLSQMQKDFKTGEDVPFVYYVEN